MNFPRCYDKRKCFAKGEGLTRDKKGEIVNYCLMLRTTYPDGKCPFCKRKRSD